MSAVVIDRRFRGPTGSGNGGYVCGRLAGLVDAPGVQVTLRVPPPLERPLSVERQGAAVRLLEGDVLVAEAEPVEVAAAPPRVVGVDEARAAEHRYRGAEDHPFPECFVCGPGREQGDGLCLRPGPGNDEALVATTWRPHASLAGNDGVVLPEFVWAALDCPGAFAAELAGRGTRVLGRLAARIELLPRAGEETVVVGWPLGGEGRRREAGTALLAADGRVLAQALAVWIEPRPAVLSAAGGSR